MLSALNLSLTLLNLHNSSHLLSPHHKWAHPLLILWSEADEEDFDEDVDDYLWWGLSKWEELCKVNKVGYG